MYYWVNCYGNCPQMTSFYGSQAETVSDSKSTNEDVLKLSEFNALVFRIKKLEEHNKCLQKQITMLRSRQGPERARKMVRRKDDELSKEFACPHPNCEKLYASRLALNLHIKLKHKEAIKVQRDSYENTPEETKRKTHEAVGTKNNLSQPLNIHFEALR